MLENDIQPSQWSLSQYDYQMSADPGLRTPPFYSLIAAAMRKADSSNLARLKFMWPRVWESLRTWYNTPGALG